MNKRTFITALILVVTALTFTVSAKKEINYLKGDKSFLKEKITATIQFDWSETTWDSKMPLQEQLTTDYDNNVRSAESAFIEEFNKIPGVQLNTQDSNEGYTAVFKVTNMDGHMGVGFKIGWETVVWGNFSIYKNGELVFESAITEFEGPKDLSRDDSITKVFKKLASKIKK